MAELTAEGIVRVRVPARAAGGYGVRIGRGAWESAAAEIAQECPAHAYALITDDTVSELHAARLANRLGSAGLSIVTLSFPAGESSKTRDTWAALSDRMIEAGLGRDSAVLAVGGGVVGDLAGFVAATYLRGVPYVQMPTTLLAMIDSSVGGKTGVDTPAGKNLIGAFHPPRLVIADPTVLSTLPRRELAAGLAEAVKHGAIADADYLAGIEQSLPSLLDGDPIPLGALVRRSVELKAGVVSRDEREAGERRALNFGHTLGHAIEALSGYELLHGEAIAIGMVLEARVGERIGVTKAGASERLEAVLAAAGLPVRLPDGFSARQVLDLTRADKKARAGMVEYSLIERIGKAAAAGGKWSAAVDDAVALAVLENR